MISPIGKANNRGVTLVELCIVGVILSLLFAVSWPAISRIARKTQIETTLSELSNTFRYARDSSLNEGKYYSVQFDAVNRQYWIAVKETPDSTDFTPLNDSLNKKRTWPEEINLNNISSLKVIFFPDGTSQDFDITLKNNNGTASLLKLQGSTGKLTTINK